MVEDEVAAFDMGVLVEVINAVGVEKGSPPLQAVDLVALFQEELGEIGPVLAGNPGDQRFLMHESLL